MKILFLSQRFLLPRDTGGKIRTGNILEHLSKNHEITLVSNVEHPKDDQYLDDMHRFCNEFVPVPWNEVKRYSLKFFVRLFFQMFSVYPVSVLNSGSHSLRKKLEELNNKNKFDVVICDFIQSSLMFKNIKNTPSIVFTHNVESMIAKRHVDQASNVIAKLFWWLQWKKMCRFEKHYCNEFDTTITVSDTDSNIFKSQFNIQNTVSIPTGVDIKYYRPNFDIEIDSNSLAFCGSMDWLPNEDAIIYFTEEILPLVKTDIPTIKLTAVGRDPTPKLISLAESNSELELTGWVEDTRPYLARSELFILPLRIGGGTRLKVYEAMAMAKTVISTTIGTEGLPLTDGDNVIFADDPDTFANKIIELLNNKELSIQIGQSACSFVRENFAWHVIAKEFTKICSDTISNFKK